MRWPWLRALFFHEDLTVVDKKIQVLDTVKKKEFTVGSIEGFRGRFVLDTIKKGEHDSKIPLGVLGVETRLFI